MPGERKLFKESRNGILTVREFDINGNNIAGYYTADDELVFILDYLITPYKPNVLLVINPEGDKKWDEIISTKYDIDLETIRPKQDNKYQKLDIEYSGLPVYKKLIEAIGDDEKIEETLKELEILRISAVRHSALSRLNTSNSIISTTNTTIVKTKEAIEKNQSAIKLLKTKLMSEKQAVGKKPTKQSASRILRIESQLEVAELKLHNAKKRLLNAQKRLDAASTEADQATSLLNIEHSNTEAPTEKQTTYNTNNYIEEVSEEKNQHISDIKPLFDEDPHILDDSNAFQPISFNNISLSDSDNDYVSQKQLQNIEPEDNVEIQIDNSDVDYSFNVPDLNLQNTYEEPDIHQIENNISYEKEQTQNQENEPIINSLKDTNIGITTSSDISTNEYKTDNPILESITPATIDDIKTSDKNLNINNSTNIIQNSDKITYNTVETSSSSTSEPHKKTTLIYYVLLSILIILSVFTLWLYQKNISKDTSPVLTIQTMADTETTIQQSSLDTSLPEDTTNVINDTNLEKNEQQTIFVDEENNNTDTDQNIIDNTLESVDIVPSSEEPSIIQSDNSDISVEDISNEVIATPAEESVTEVNKPEYNTSVSSENIQFSNDSESNVFLDDSTDTVEEEYYED